MIDYKIEQKKIKETGEILIIFVGVVIGIVLMIGADRLFNFHAQTNPKPCICMFRSIPTIRQLQQALNGQGLERYYVGEEDGIPGKCTLEGWINWSNDSMFERSIQDMPKAKERMVDL